MKKVPFRLNTNKQRLQLNRANSNQTHYLMPKRCPLKENLNNFQKLQQKEESSTNIHHLPSISSITAAKRTPAKSQCTPSQPSAQKIPSSSSKTKIRIRRPSSTREVKNCQEMVRLPIAAVRGAVDGFILMLQNKKILQRKQTNFNLSSQSMRSILLFIITTQKQSWQNQTAFLQKMVQKESLDDFLRLNDKQQSLSASRGQLLRLCSGTISVVEWDSGVNGQMVKELARVAGVLVREVAELDAHKEQLKEEINGQVRCIKENQRKNLTLQLELESRRTEMEVLKGSVTLQKELLMKTQVKKAEIENFVSSQANLIAKEAAEYHKNLEIDMFQYADFLRHHPLGRKDFEPSIFYHQIQRMLNAQVKQGIASLLTPNPLQQKQQSLKDFVKGIRHQYKLMIDQLTRTITEKTKYIHNFTEVVHRWYENYLAKKEYLSGLTEAFSLEAVTLQHLRQGIEAYCGEEMAKGKTPPPSPACMTALWKIFAGVDKLVELFGLGNSFY